MIPTLAERKMTESPLMIKSKELALEVIKVCKEFRISKCESALINQFLRSGTSVGANVREAQYAHGTADFIAKLQIVLKECCRYFTFCRRVKYFTSGKIGKLPHLDQSLSSL